jgi:hypothetical protein
LGACRIPLLTSPFSNTSNSTNYLTFEPPSSFEPYIHILWTVPSCGRSSGRHE